MTDTAHSGVSCPLCGGPNHCAGQSGSDPKSCWCTKEVFPREVLELVPEEHRRKTCICRTCLNEHKRNMEKDVE